MSIEIERKFLVHDTAFLSGFIGERLVQGYIANTARATVRLRIAGDRAWLTLKGRSHGISRRELEYPVPLADAELALAELCEGPLLDKTRYRVPHGPHLWEVDVFAGQNAGLVLAEVELGSEQETVDLPPWVGEEVSTDPRYYNVNLARDPYTGWSPDAQ